MHFIQIDDWIFDTQAQQISRTQQLIQLEPICSALLYYLCQNCERIITRDDLICHVWNNRLVTDSAINRVISMLRKHLGDDPQKASYIRTVHKQGYLLLASVRELSEQEALLHKHKKPQGFIRSLTLNNVFIFMLLSAVSWLSVNNMLKSRQHEIVHRQITIEPIVTEKGQEAFVTLSSNDEFLVYSHTRKNGDFYHLYLKQLTSGKVIQLTKGGHNDFGASIDADNQYIYFARLVPGQSCQIMRLALFVAEVIEPEPITQCNKSLAFTNVSIHPNNKYIFYNDSAKGKYVYRYDMESMEKIRVTNIAQSDVTDFYHTLSPDGDKLAFVRYDNSAYKIMLKKLDQTEHEEVLWMSSGPPIFSVSWSKDSQHINFLEKRFNQVISINLSDDHVMINVLENGRINGLTNQQSNGDVYAVSGNQNQYDISSIPLTSSLINNRDMIVASTANDFRAVQVNKTNTFYVSDRSGMFQFWLRNIDGLDQQLSTFDENRSYVNLASDPSGKSIVGLTDGRLFKFTILTAKFEWITLKESKANFPFFDDKGTLYYIDKGERSGLMSLNDNGEDTLIVSGAVYGDSLGDKIMYQEPSGDIYFIGSGKISPTLLIKNMSLSGQVKSKVITDKGLYFVKVGDNRNGKSKSGIYYQPFNQTEATLVTSGKPNPFGGISLDRYNQRILIEEEEDIDTNIVKVSFIDLKPDNQP